MKIQFPIGDRIFDINAYTTQQEKEILLLDSFGVNDIDQIFGVLGFKTNYDLSIEEKKVILYKHREISIGDEVNIKFVCDKCKQANDSVLLASNFIKDQKRNDEDIKTFAKQFDEENMQEYVDINIDDLDINEYEELRQRIIDNQLIIDFTKSAHCLKCKNEKKFDMSNTKYIIEIMSDDTLMTLFKTYNYLNFFGHYSKLDIDSMYPFERSVFVGLLNKTKEDLAK